MEHSITPAAQAGNQAQGPLARRIVLTPAFAAAPEAQARVADWLAEIADRPAAAALAQLLAEQPAVRALLGQFTQGAPYLWDLVRADPARLLALLQSDPAQCFEDILGRAAHAAAATPDEAGIMALLRRLKAEAALLIALADASGVWEVMRVTAALTQLADTAVGLAVRHLLHAAAAEGALTPVDPQRPEQESGYIVLAMGK
ncbi:MAG TPA: bifunctional [glutamine synthetase] adenylyltransferase/[glutamine synthetase]-adenylyl-L-tyrosine phosphorylase, partial [Xanthobacteraceae bacterium]